ncbi:MAG: transposase [Anaerolineales bacterium]
MARRAVLGAAREAGMTFPSQHDPTHLYFVTATVCGWKHLFAHSPYAEIVLNSLSWLRCKKRMLLFAFVVMPSHLHWIAKPVDRTISEVIQDFGSFTAHEILKRLKADQSRDLLKFFHDQRRDRCHQHSIWQDIQAKNIHSHQFLRQKLDYIHNNPLDKQWRLAATPAEYRYSSACYYDLNAPPIIEVDDIRPWL